MSNLPAARKRNAWLPNRMFDPVSNPFAIQNLLDREEPPFIEARDERPEVDFGIDPLAGGSIIKAFEVDRGLQLPDDDFSVDTSVSGEFVAEDAMPDAGFESEEQPDIYAAFTGGIDDEPAVESQAVEMAASIPAAGEAGDAPSVDAETAEPEWQAVAAATTAAEETTKTMDAVQTADVAETLAEALAAPVVEPDADPVAAESPLLPDAVAEPAMMAEPEPVEAPQPDLTSEAVMQMVEAARAEAYAQGLEAGRSEGRDAERPLAHKQGYDEGYAAGVEHAKAQTQTDEQKQRQQQHQIKLDQLQAVIDNLQQLAYNPDAMFEPMKKLTVYLAEQLVRGELAQSPQAISRLVDNALRELNASGDKAVIIHLNPDDLEAYRPTVANFGDSLILRPDTMLERGGVRVSLDGSVVEDLMQRRVDGLKKSMAQAPAPTWRAGGNSLAARVQQGQPVDDVTVVDKNDKTDKALETAAPTDGHA